MGFEWPETEEELKAFDEKFKDYSYKLTGKEIDPIKILNDIKMDTTRTENEALTIKHIQWLGMKNENGAFTHRGLEGEVQYYDNGFHYYVDNKAVKELKIEKHLNDLIIPIKNAEIAIRNETIRRTNLIEKVLDNNRDKEDVSNHRLAAYINKKIK